MKKGITCSRFFFCFVLLFFVMAKTKKTTLITTTAMIKLGTECTVCNAHGSYKSQHLVLCTCSYTKYNLKNNKV